MGTTAEIMEILGGPKVLGKKIASESDFLAAIHRGLPYGALEQVKQRLKLTDRELVHSIDIHPRTLHRRKSERRLRSDESDRLSRLARVTAHAIEILGSEENAIRWLRHPNGALGGASPLSYLSTDVGARRVEAILSHIDYGDVS
jgi:putative toxin-antitoxin system antitoxin component (TIGR02293 family)